MNSLRDDEPKSGKHRTAGRAVVAARGLGVGAVARSPFERVFTIGTRYSVEIFISCFLCAGIAHGAVGAVLVRKHTDDVETVTEIIDVDLTEAKDKEKEQEKEKEKEPEPVVDPTSTAAQSPAATNTAKPTDAPRPKAGSLGNLLAAKPDPNAPKTDNPVEFETDPNGNEFAGGTSQIGGGPDPGKPGASKDGVKDGTGTGDTQKGPPKPPPPPPPPVATVDKTRAPKLNEPNACKGFFPSDADDDAATVQVLITVQPNGQVTTASVLSEDPKGQGFGKAARTCLLSKKFEAGLDKAGNPAVSTTTVNLRFVRY